MMNMNEYLTLEYLGTFAGVTAVTTLIVQFLKLQADRIWKIPTRYIVYLIALILLLVVQAFQGSLTFEKIFLNILNAILVSMASMGTYDISFAKLEKK
jgi:hypothetical protein